MVKIFEKDGKVNIVDDMNVVAGFAAAGICCETFGYCFAPREIIDYKELFTEEYYPESPLAFPQTVENQDRYQFDTRYYKVQEGMAQFRLKGYGQPDVYLIFFNIHEGYYMHNFDFCKGETIIISDEL